jgi:hypothetical protein
MSKRDGVESSLAPTVKKNSPRGFVLDKEKITVKFNKHIVISNKARN